MAEPFIGEIKIFAGTYAPRDWAWCNGQTIEITQNQALYVLIGNQFGGNGSSSFKLPDLRGRVPVHPDSRYSDQGEYGGRETVTLNIPTMAGHSHTAQASAANADAYTARNKSAAFGNNTPENIYTSAENLVNCSEKAVSATTQGGEAHNNMQPSLALTYIIALQGQFPSRN